MLLLPQKHLLQPQYDTPINPEWLARGLVVVCNPAVGAYNQVSRQFVTNSGGLGTTPTNRGQAWSGAASKYIDFGEPFAPTSGCTVLQVISPGSVTSQFPWSNRNGSSVLGIEALVGNGGTPGLFRARMHSPEVATGDISGLNDGKDHVTITRFTPSTELKVWVDSFSNSSSNTTSIPASTTSTQNLRLHSRSTSYFLGKSGLFLYFDRPLWDVYVAALLQNPYIIYQGLSRRIYTAVSAPPPTGGYGFVKVSGSWKTLSGTYVKVAGVWKQGTFSPKVSGSWKALV